MLRRTPEQKAERRRLAQEQREAEGYYVYLLLDDEGKPHYVGSGRGERARISRYRHRLPDGRPAPSYILLKEHLSKEESVLLEGEFILFHWGTITNTTKPGKRWGKVPIHREKLKTQ